MAKKGEVTYEIRADDSKVESDLEKANKKVEQSEKKTAQESEKIEKDTAEVKKDVKEDVTEHHKQENKKQEQSDEESYKTREEAARGHGAVLKGLAGGTATAIGAGMLAAGAAITGLGIAAVNSANDVDKAMNQYLASTGKGTEETERYKNVMEEIYMNNYGDSFEDIGQAMAEVTKTLGDMDDASLQEITESAFALRDTFEYDISESARAAKAMMDNFGVSGDKAMSLIAAGAQNGLDYSGELLDSISEYSVQFAKVGLDADDMFKIFQKGAESGAFNLDKVGDAVKEMAIRVVDGSDTTRQGFEAIGLNADEMSAKFAAGGESAKEAFNQTVDALAAMEDPLAQNQAGVALFGTMWEDLGADAVTALAEVEDGAYDTGEAMKSIKNIKYDDIGSVFEGLKRSLEVLIIPLGEQLIPLLAELIDDVLPLLEEALPPIVDAVSEVISALMPAIEEVLPQIMEALGKIGEPLMQMIDEILPILLDTFNQVLPLLADLASEVLPIVADFLSTLVPPLAEIVNALLPPLLELASALLPIFEAAISVLEPILELFTSLLDPIVNLISNGVTPLINALNPLIELIKNSLIRQIQILSGVFGGVFEGILETVTSVIGNITNIFRDIVDFVRNVFTGNWSAAWQNVVDIFSNIVSAIGEIFKAPINFLIDGINGFINSVNKIKIPDWVPKIGGKGFNIPNIPRLKIGMDYVPSDMFPAYLDKGEWVLTKEEADYLRSFGGLEGMTESLERASNDVVNVTVQGGNSEIDYVRLGNAVVDAIVRAGLGIKCDDRVFGQVIKDVIDYV